MKLGTTTNTGVVKFRGEVESQCRSQTNLCSCFQSAHTMTVTTGTNPYFVYPRIRKAIFKLPQRIYVRIESDMHVVLKTVSRTQ